MRKAGISNLDLSERTGVNKGTLSSFLNGNRSISNKNLDLILDSLNLTLVPISNFKCSVIEEKKGTDKN